ncbi:MAG TPA: TorF family putative porin [Usitatibacter sp.]|nr:TorF family putative porin [Usitatibacter sp.]
MKTPPPAAFAACALFLPMLAHAQAATSPHSFAGKVALYSEYEYRGLAQTSEKPALQGTFDYAHASGFYVGTFITNISWLKDTGEVLNREIDGRIEWDIYAGYKWGFADGWTLDVGYLRYQYPGSNEVPALFSKPNTDEVYAGLSYGPATLKYSYGLSDIFGVPGSKGSDYLELTVNQPIMDKLTLNGLIGHQRYKGRQQDGNFDNSDFSYTVWKLGATYDFGNGFAVGAYYKDTNADPIYFTFLGRDWSDKRVVGFVSYSF